VVKVLDKGPYRESLEVVFPADTGLVSEVGTDIVFPNWRPWGAATKGKSNYYGWRITLADGFRLAGLRFRGPKLPGNTEVAWGLEFNRVRGEVTVEDCCILHDFPRYTFTPGTHEVYPYFWRGLMFNKHFTPRSVATRIALRDNWIEGMVDFTTECRATILLEHNCIIGWRNDALYLPRQTEDVVLRHNVIAGWFGPGITERAGHTPKGRPEPRYLIANNVLYSVEHPLAAAWLRPGPLNDVAPPPKNVRMQNNLVWSRDGHGISLNPADLAVVGRAWQVGHNAYVAQPKPWRESPALPPGPSDKIVAKPFLSDDQTSGNFLHIAADSPLATGGAGGDLPGYIGAFPPGPAQSDDWFSRLRSRVEEVRAAGEE
jgi:hypothetical protein